MLLACDAGKIGYVIIACVAIDVVDMHPALDRTIVMHPYIPMQPVTRA
jgi:hypothetical protein